MNTTFQASGGGGAGGYVEAVIVHPAKISGQFPYSLSKGGQGGGPGVTGESAQKSWFSDPAHVFANGGQGGAIGAYNDSPSHGRDENIAEGGAGGESGGIYATRALKGGSGEDGIASGVVIFNPMWVRGGRGGAAGTRSGNTISPSQVLSGSTNGVRGLNYGGGGSGSCCVGEPDGALGGDGADAHMLILSYGN